MTTETYDRRSCDRCGFTVEVRKVERGEPKDWTQVTSRAFGRHVAGEDGSTVDLCPDCHSSLIEWMPRASCRRTWLCAGMSKITCLFGALHLWPPHG